MLIDRLAATLRTSTAYGQIAEILDAGKDATLATPGLVRPALVAALYATLPRPMLVVVSGEEAAERFWRQTAAYLGKERVLHLPDRSDFPWSDSAADLEQVGARAKALHCARQEPPGDRRDVGARADARGASAGQPRVRAARARRGRRDRPRAGGRAPRGHGLRARVRCRSARHLRRARRHPRRLPLRQRASRARRALRRRGRHARVATCPAPARRSATASRSRSSRSARWRCRAAVPSSPIARSRSVRTATRSSSTTSSCCTRACRSTGWSATFRCSTARPSRPPTTWAPRRSSIVAEPRSLFDDTVRRREELETAAKTADFKSVREGAAPLEGLYLSPAELDFGDRQRLTLLSLLRAGGAVDAELVARRPDVAGGEEKFVGSVRALTAAGSGVVLAVPDRRTRRRIADALAEAGVAVSEQRDHVAAESASDSAPGAAPGTEPAAPQPAARSRGAADRRRRSCRLRRPGRPRRRSSRSTTSSRAR